MSGHRRKLRLFYLAVCASQLVVTGMGLAVAYQVLNSYSRDISYEISLNTARRTLTEMEVLARAASPERLTLDDETSGPAQLLQVDYACNLFLPKAQALLDQSEHVPNSPLGHSQSHLQFLISEMDMVKEQSRLAGEAWAEHDTALARARLTYTDRAATRVQEILNDIDQDMLKGKDEALISESAQASQTRLILLPLSIVGALLLLPALRYARHLDHNLLAYEAELENEKNLLEERVTTRTFELRAEMEHRKRMQDFNNNRNHLLEQVAEGKDLHEILGRLAQSAEQCVPRSQCIVLLKTETVAKAISPSVSLELTVYLETILLRSWDSVSLTDPRGEIAVFLTDRDSSTKIRFSDVWAQGYAGILAVPIMDPQQPLQGVIALLLWEDGEPDSLARDVLLSASRMASVALKNNRMQDELFRRAHQDALTNLPNRALFQDRMQQALARASRSNLSLGMLCLDLDGFKEINDRYGHETGDQLLQEVALRLGSFIRKSDTVARIGGDEFVASIGDIRERQDLANLCQSLLRLLEQPYSLGGVTIRITASIGAALFPADGNSCEDLTRHADVAMYRAKEQRNTYQMFSVDLGEKLARRRQIEQYLQEALQGEGFEIHYQPICSISGVLVGLEALLRFSSPELTSISPGEFILVAEQTGQISAVGDWVLREACRQGKQWQDEGFSPLPIAVNVSPIQLGRQDFAERVKQILTETGLTPQWLHIEVTETAVMSNFEEGRLQLCALADLGVQISIDDFGTGYSSLSYLHCLPIKALKIDRSFVQQMVDSQESKAIVRAIIAMAQSLELDVVAEGVETHAQLRAVAAAGCGTAQGYLFSKPLERTAVRTLLKNATVPLLGEAYSTNKT